MPVFIDRENMGMIHLYKRVTVPVFELMATLSKARTDKVFCIIDTVSLVVLLTWLNTCKMPNLLINGL